MNTNANFYFPVMMEIKVQDKRNVGGRVCVGSAFCQQNRGSERKKNERQSRYAPQTINRLNASLCLLWRLEFSEANLLVINYIFPQQTDKLLQQQNIAQHSAPQQKVSHLWLYTIFYALFIVWLALNHLN